VRYVKPGFGLGLKFTGKPLPRSSCGSGYSRHVYFVIVSLPFHGRPEKHLMRIVQDVEL
jgi:hypothetical protein